MKLKNRIAYILKHNGLFQLIYIFLASSFFRFIGLFLQIDNKLVLMNGHGYKYNDSPRAIYEKMAGQGLTKKYRVVWAFEDLEKYKDLECEKVKIDTFKYFVIALKAKYWISCVNIERALHFKKRKTIYLNTWHGAMINLCGNAVGSRKDFKWKYVDYFCSCSDFETPYLLRDFGLRPESIINTGYPRNDFLYNRSDNCIVEIKKKLCIPLEKKVILYAPTWRDSDDGGATFGLTPPVDFRKWRKLLGDKYVLLLRTHPYTTELLNVEFDDFVKDFTEYPVVNELLMVSDFLISDYSSILLDYSILERPIICFGYDYESYKKQRGFYYKLEDEIPSGVLKTEDEVLSYILNINYESECQKVKAFKEKHMQYGGEATDYCIKLLFNMEGRKND